MMATFAPIVNLIVTRYGLEEWQCGINILELRSREIEPGLLPRSNGEEYCVEAAGKFVEGNVEADPGIEHHFYADALNEVELAPKDRLGEPVFGNGKAQHTARFAAFLKNGDVMAKHRQIEGCSEAGGTCTCDGHFASGRWQSTREDSLDHGFKAIGLIDLVRDEAVDFTHIDHFIEGLTAAAIVAGMLADSSGGGRQGIIKNNGLERIFKAAFLVELKETGNVHAQRATVFARREGEFLADTRAAAVRPRCDLHTLRGNGGWW